MSNVYYKSCPFGDTVAAHSLWHMARKDINHEKVSRGISNVLGIYNRHMNAAMVIKNKKNRNSILCAIFDYHSNKISFVKRIVGYQSFTRNVMAATLHNKVAE